VRRQFARLVFAPPVRAIDLWSLLVGRSRRRHRLRGQVRCPTPCPSPIVLPCLRSPRGLTTAHPCDQSSCSPYTKEPCPAAPAACRRPRRPEAFQARHTGSVWRGVRLQALVQPRHLDGAARLGAVGVRARIPRPCASTQVLGLTTRNREIHDPSASHWPWSWTPWSTWWQTTMLLRPRRLSDHSGIYWPSAGVILLLPFRSAHNDAAWLLRRLGRPWSIQESE